MKTYHAHVYFDVHNLEKARALLSRAHETGYFSFANLSPKVGPHPLPMIELHFDRKSKNEVIEWLKENPLNSSVLIHEDTGEDVRDHTENVLWLGPALKLDFEFFELIKTKPHLKVHK